MYSPLILPMMMYGKFRQTRTKRDKDGNPIIKNGKRVMEKYWKIHNELDGDPGVYPSVNHIYVRMRNGRQRLSEPAQNLMDRWAALAKMWVKDNNWEIADEKVVIEMTAHFPNDNRKRDTHNAFKLMLDALEDIIYTNDRYALPRTMDFKKVKEGEQPYFELNIYKKEQEYEILQKRLEQWRVDQKVS